MDGTGHAKMEMDASTSIASPLATFFKKMPER